MSDPKTYHNPINGEFTRIIESSVETNGLYSLLEVKLNSGGKNPVHFHHHFTEEFEAVEGILHLKANKAEIQLQPGEKQAVPPGVAHQFYNPTAESITFRVRLTPGQPDFENFIKATFGLVTDGKTWKNQIPKSLYHTAILLKWGDTHLTNYFVRAGEPMLDKVYQQAVKKGIEKALKEKYC